MVVANWLVYGREKDFFGHIKRGPTEQSVTRSYTERNTKIGERLDQLDCGTVVTQMEASATKKNAQAR